MRTLKEILNGMDMDEFLLRASLDFGFFYFMVLGMEFARHHEEWFELFDRNKRVCIIAPRQHGKTTLLSGYFVWKAFFNRNLNILIVSDSHSQSKDVLMIIKNMIEDNELLKSLLPEDRDVSWSRTEIMTTTKVRMVTRANNEKIRGGSYDYVMCDEGGQYTDKSNFYGVIQPTVEARHGSIFVIGTPISKIDLLAELSNEGSGYKFATYRAIDGDVPLWPGKYTTEQLMRIKSSMPSLNWEREYLCNPIGDESSLFPYELIHTSFDKSAKFRTYGDPTKRYFGGFDSAMSPKAGADYSVWFIVEVDGNNNKRIVRMERSKGESFQSQFDRTKRLNQNFRVTKWEVDEGSFGKVFCERFKEENICVEPFAFGGGGKSEKRNDLLMKLRNQFENAKMIIPRDPKDGETISQTDILIEELMSIAMGSTPQGKPKWESVAAHDDTVFALALAIEGCTNSYGSISLCYI